MKKSPVSYLILFYCLFASFYLNAQPFVHPVDTIQQKVVNAASEYFKKYPREKIFVHTDQNVYITGQTVWYKIYSQAYGKPSALSKIVYLRIADDKGNNIVQDKRPLENGTAYGNLTLADTLHSGWYHITAFTAWMLNFDKRGIYQKKIYLKNVIENSPPDLTPVIPKNYHISFFPEGGDLVEGNVGNVAFKATDEKGMPVPVYGDVIDKARKTQSKFSTSHDGMGSFTLEGYANESYTAIVHFPGNSVQKLALPQVKKSGCSLLVNQVPGDELELKIFFGDMKQQNRDIVLAAVQSNGLVVTYPLKLSRGVNILSLKKNNFSTGILRLTIFEQTGLPAAERVVFVNNNDQLKISLVKDTLSFAPKSKNVFTLNVTDNNGQPIKADLSIAIADGDTGGQPADNISSYLLISSELTGYIHQPAYYFKNNSDTLQKQLDLVMLTNGWRHFKWEKLFDDKPLKLRYAVEQSQLIAGKIGSYTDNDHYKIKMMITNHDSSTNAVSMEPDSTGLFIIQNYNHQGQAKLYYEIMDAKNKKVSATIKFLENGIDTVRIAADTLSNNIGAEPRFNKVISDSFYKNSSVSARRINLKTVKIEGQKLDPTESLLRSHVKNLDALNASTLTLVDTDLPTSSIIDYIQGRFPNLNVLEGPDGSVTFTYHGISSVTSAVLSNSGSQEERSDGEPYFYIDESLASLQEVKSIPLTDVALIRFIPPPVYFAPLNGGVGGALLVYTKRLGDDKRSIKSGRTPAQYLFNGYSITREFSSPDYSIATPKLKPDNRTTLFWSHDLKIDESGKTKIQFYNSDQSKRYRVVIQGIDKSGRIANFYKEF